MNKARDREVVGYVEKHHIIPESLGGPNSKDNLVKLTAREHFVAHLLLVKMVEKGSKRKMAWALHRMAFSKKHGMERHLSSREFELARKTFAAATTGTKQTEETKRRISEARTGVCTPAQLAALQATHKKNKGRKATETTKARLSKAQRESEKAKAHRQKLVERQTGVEHSQERRSRLKASLASSPKVQAYHQRRREEAARKKAASARG